MKIYHNPRCRKSRETLSIINEHNVNVNIVEYLKYPPTKKAGDGLLGSKALNGSFSNLPT